MFTSSAQLVDDVWDEVLTGATHNISTSAGKRLRQLADVVIVDGTSPDTGGTANTAIRMELDSAASAVDGTYDPAVIVIVLGTGAGQSNSSLFFMILACKYLLESHPCSSILSSNGKSGTVNVLV